MMRSSGRRTGAILTAVLTLAAGLTTPLAAADPPSPSAASNPPDETVVGTAEGAVRGRVDGDHLVFQGIPFAQPPVGRLRFRAPRPVEPWTGVRDATERASMCAQTHEHDGPVTFYGSEDCLYLNVHIPRGADEPLPVMVFLHGGGFGGGDSSAYDPRPVSRQGDVIVVTANYRLGALGFMRHPSLRDPWAGNFGIADQQAALKWVQRNIAMFGGDSGNVTLWGESAGAYSVCTQLASPRARGLFDRAIMQSGPCGNDLLPRHEAERRASSVAAELGCDDRRQAARCLRQLPASEISRSRYEDVRLTRLITNLPWMPVAGTRALPVQPMRAIRNGSGADVPLLLGGTKEEMRTFIVDRYHEGLGLVTEEQYPQLVHDLYGSDADRVLAAYPHQRYDSPSSALATILTDEGRGAGACRLVAFADAAARRSPVFMYEFAEPSDRPSYVPGFPLGASHGADVPYFFDSYETGSGSRTEPRERLAEALIGHWTAFARTGEPGGDWPAYGPGQGRSFSAGHTATVDLATSHRCGFWEELDPHHRQRTPGAGRR